MSNDQIISVAGLSHRLGRFELAIPELTMERGYVLGLLGRNGAGKSTTLGALVGLIKPTAGNITVLGLPVRSAAVEVRRRVGFVPEQAAFYDGLNATQTAAILAPFYPGWSDKLLQRYLTRLEIDAKQPIRSYSKGMRVKLALALALSHAPELLILDEPTAGLDPVVRQMVVGEIAGLVKDGQHSVIISSHITSDLAIADYIGILDAGRLILHDDQERLRERWRKVSGAKAHATSTPAGLFLNYRSDGASFAGVTDHYSTEWRCKVERAGLRIDVIAQLTLDEILAYATGQHRQPEDAKEVA
jgi:ABC-2 type transport system ATP-binding protein